MNGKNMRAKVEREGHEWNGRTVVVVDKCPHSDGGRVVCELQEEQHMEADKRSICSLPESWLSYVAVEIDRLLACGNEDFNKGYIAG
jgi:hypothetical protein